VSTGAKIAIGVAGAAALYFLFAGSASAALTPGASAPAPSSSDCGSISNFIGGHVDRKNAIAPLVASKYTGLPPSVTKPFTDVAGKLDLSARVENAIDKPLASALCHVSVKQAVTSTIKAASNPAATIASKLPGSKYTTAVLDPGAAISASGHGTAGKIVGVLTNPVGAIGDWL
jgi:hypothetical protein